VYLTRNLEPWSFELRKKGNNAPNIGDRISNVPETLKLHTAGEYAWFMV